LDEGRWAKDSEERASGTDPPLGGVSQRRAIPIPRGRRPSNLYDVHKVWELLLAGEDVRKAFRRGVYGIWSQSAEADPQQGLARLMAERPNRSLGRDQPETL